MDGRLLLLELEVFERRGRNPRQTDRPTGRRPCCLISSHLPRYDVIVSISSSSLVRASASSVRGRLKNSDRAFDFTLETTIALLLPRACPPRRQPRCRRLGRPRPRPSLHRRILNPFEGNRTTFGARGNFIALPPLIPPCKLNCVVDDPRYRVANLF